MYQVHEFEWSDSSVEQFWNYYSRQNKISYFAQQVGEEVFRFAQKYVYFEGHTLDYGCGKGHLVGVMLKRGLKNVYGADFSKDSVTYVRESYQEHPGFRDGYVLTQLPAPELKDNFFDSVFLLETIEHLIPPHLDNTLTELSRIVKPQGHVIITTPANEDLDMQKVLCPDCGAHFHRVQHVNSFSEDSIIHLMSKYGFEKIYCDSINLEGYFNFRKRLARTIKKLMHMETAGVNLVYIGKKK